MFSIEFLASFRTKEQGFPTLETAKLNTFLPFSFEFMGPLEMSRTSSFMSIANAYYIHNQTERKAFFSGCVRMG